MAEQEAIAGQESQAPDGEEFAPAWRPNKGDGVKGKVVEITAIDPSGRGPYPCLTIETSDGHVAVHAFHTVLRRELARRTPQIGDEIGIVYRGKQPGGQGAEYHNYKVTGGRVVDFDWSQELPADERSQTTETPIAPAAVPQAKPLSAEERVEAQLPPVPEYDDVPF